MGHCMTVWGIVGSRGYSDEGRAKKIMRDFVKPGDIIISGGASGPDTWAKEVANELGVRCKEFIADWKEYGKRAGVIRNTQIVKTCDRILAFWDGSSRGTLDTIKKATMDGQVVLIFGPKRDE